MDSSSPYPTFLCSSTYLGKEYTKASQTPQAPDRRSDPIALYQLLDDLRLMPFV